MGIVNQEEKPTRKPAQTAFPPISFSDESGTLTLDHK